MITRRIGALLVVCAALAVGCSSGGGRGDVLPAPTSTMAPATTAAKPASPTTNPASTSDAIVASTVATSAPPAFYQPPSPLPAGPAGTILRQEGLPQPAGGGQAWRILYLSTGVDGRPAAVSGILAQPAGAPPPGGWPVVTWAHSTAGSADACAPSLGGATAAVPLLADLLAAGYVVVATDYEGLGTPGPHPYLVGQSEGRSVLDAARAARLAIPTANGPVLVWGHSQGGHAALWAGEVAAEVASELPVLGVAAFAPPARLDAFLSSATPPSALLAGFTVAAAVGLQHARPDLSLADLLTPAALARVGLLETACIAEVALSFGTVPGGVLAPGATTAASWRAAIDANSAGERRSPAPVLVLQGDRDVLVSDASVSTYVTAACRSATVVERRRYPEAGHSEVVRQALGEVLAWSADRLAGRPAASSC